MNYFNAVNISHNLITQYLKQNSICVDATCGNGTDTLFLSKLLKNTGYVYAFDIQKQACVNTSSILRRENVTNAKVICDSHDKIDYYINEKIDCAVYNLGYLPNSDSKITTKYKSTISSLSKVLELLNHKGFIVICSYVGHLGGMKEHKRILNYISKIDRELYQTLVIEQPNNNNSAPKVIFIKKK